MQEIKQIILQSAESALWLQNNDGSFPPGHNGPWNDKDTPVRVTAHFSILLKKAYDLTNDERFRENAIKAGNYLLSKKARLGGFSFYCRDGKNKCNGLIGQAWAIEALNALAEYDTKSLNTAEEVILKHTFNKKQSIWHNLETDGTKLNVNKTLNQQVWFSAMAYQIGKKTKNKSIIANSEAFFRNLDRNMKFNGRFITHLIHPFSIFIYKEQSLGYLSFVLMGLADAYNLERKLVSEQVKKKIISSIRFMNKNIIKSKYAWSYNPTGFEMAYAIHTFSPSAEQENKWTERQMKYYNPKICMMDKSDDINTFSSRIYEICRLI